MDDIFVARLMTTDLRTVTPETLVEDAAAEMLENDVNSLLVVDEDNRLEGILTSTDFVRIVAKSQPKAETAVDRYMTTDVVTASAQDPIRDVADAMLEHGFRHMPVVDDEEGVIGIVSSTDLAAYVAQLQPSTPA